MSRSLEHRGPDDVGFMGWSPAGACEPTRDATRLAGANGAFVHRRLSIIDQATGWQPMQSHDGAYSIVFNGEIYNFIELRDELERAGVQFRSRCDTEVLLEAYARWGAAALTRFVGMFAFAILDLRKRCVFLARDHFGIKPLYFTQGSYGFAFASEATALLDVPGVTPVARSLAVYEYLRFGSTDAGSGTLWKDIQQLPAGHCMEVPLDLGSTAAPCRYWAIPPYEPLDISFAEAAERVRDLFVENVRLHLRSDVRVGACLSGGIDSSAIVMSMRGLLDPGAPISTFSYVASDPRVSEERWMRVVACAAGTDSAYTRPTETDLRACVSDLVRAQGEPFGSTSIFAQYAVFQLAGAAGIKVMLDGQGADELLGGYWGFVAARMASLLGRGQVLGAAGVYRGAVGQRDTRGLNLLAMSAGMLAPPAVQRFGRKLVRRGLAPEWLDAQWFRSHGVTPAAPWQDTGPNHLHGLLSQSVTGVTLPMLLRYEDRSSMRFSIESRVPFLTREFAEFVLALPEQYIVDPKGERKSVFRAAMRGIVPDAILDRKDKIGFQTSEPQWMASLSPWVTSRMNSEAAHSIPMLKLPAIRTAYQRFVAGGPPLGMAAWRWVNMIEWTEQFNVRFDA